MAEPKTRPTNASVKDFLAQVTDEGKRKDSQAIVKLMTDVTGEKPVMWGSSIIGFGSYNYKAERGGEAEWMMLGFSPRKSDLTIYVMPSAKPFAETLKRLGKFKTSGGSCLYIKKLADIDEDVLRELLNQSVQVLSEKKMGQQSKAAGAVAPASRKKANRK